MKNKRDRKEIRKEGQALSLILQLSINMIFPILCLSLLGSELDKYLHTNYLVIIGFVVGVLGGFTSNYKMIRHFLKKDEQSSLNPTAGLDEKKKGDEDDKKDN